MNQQRLKEVLRYEPDTGKFFWLVSNRKLKAGDEVRTSLNKLGYRMIFFEGKQYLSHRLAWLYVHGFLPKTIDHVNGERSDNGLPTFEASPSSKTAGIRKGI